MTTQLGVLQPQNEAQAHGSNFGDFPLKISRDSAQQQTTTVFRSTKFS
jgi:hypothetical protein